MTAGITGVIKIVSTVRGFTLFAFLWLREISCQIGMDAKLVNILKDKVASEWKIFAFCTGFNDVAAVFDQIDHDIDQKGHDDLTREKSKIEFFLQKLYEQHPNDYRACIQNSLKVMKRNDVLQDITLLGLMGDTPSKTAVKQSIVDFQETDNNLHNITDPNNSPASSLHHEGKPLVGQGELERDKTAVSLHIDLNLSQSAPSSSSNEGPSPRVAIHDSAADDDEEKVNLLKDQTKMSDILDNPILLFQLEKMVGKDWQKLGRLLLVNDNELDVIDVDYNDLEEKAHRMFCAWKNQQKSPTSDDLAKAIYQINRLDLIRVMEKFSNKSFERENPLKPSIEEKEKMRGTLKKFYQMTYGKIDQLEHNVISPTNFDLLNKFVELTVVDANDAERDIVNIAERELFLRKQSNYKPIEFYELFSKELPLLLISGIAGIGKTCLLRKCLLDWASNTLWKDVDLVLYFECRKLNQYQNIVSINELLNVFYKNVLNECDICEHFSILFVIDGLDEFAYLDELINHNPLNPSKQPIVNVLADVLDFHKYKCVVAGRVGAILQYKNKMTECSEKLTIQIMGFNDYGINEYVERVGNAKEAIKNVLKSSHIAKAMASVPFYLSAMCTVIGSSILSDSYSFFTTTELYCCIFIYFLQKHINRNKEPVYKLMEKESTKQYILKVCKVAFHLFNEGKVVFSQKEIKVLINDIDEIENDNLGFIEKVESQLGHQYQFVHLTLMEFCASIHAHINWSSKEILSNKKLRSCLPMICGLKNENGGPFLSLLANLKASKEESNSMLVKIKRFLSFSNEERNSLVHAVLDLLPKFIDWYDDEYKMFIECFFEAQASITEDMKKSIDERLWKIYISDGKTPHEVSHEKYFMEKFFDAGCKLNNLNVKKKILSEDEKKLVILCSTNVYRVWLYHPVKIDGWTPKHKIEWLQIYISDTFVSKNEFEGFILPWIRLTEKLYLHLHDDTNFVDDICEWLRGSNFKELWILYRGKEFDNIEEFKARNTKNV